MNSLRFRLLAFSLPAVVFLALAAVSVYGQYGAISLTISPTQLQLGESVNFDWVCPSVLFYANVGPGATLPFGYAQITVTRVQEFPKSIPPYDSPQFRDASGSLPYEPPTNGTFTAILRCYYLGSMIGLGYVSCPACRDAGQFIVTPYTAPVATTTTTSLPSITPTSTTAPISLTSASSSITNLVAPTQSTEFMSSTTQLYAVLIALLAALLIVTMVLLRKRRASEKRERTQIY